MPSLAVAAYVDSGKSSPTVSGRPAVGLRGEDVSDPSQSFDYDLEQVLPFAQSLIPGLARTDGMRCIGLRKDGELVAAAVYEGFNGQNMWVHLAGVPGQRWMTRDFLRAGFAYPFLVCGVQRLSGYVNSSNLAARRLNEHFGYRVEATLKGAAPDGGDVLIYVMWRKDCRYV